MVASISSLNWATNACMAGSSPANIVNVDGHGPFYFFEGGLQALAQLLRRRQPSARQSLRAVHELGPDAAPCQA